MTVTDKLPYTIEGPLGGGAYTDVYLARGESGQVAVKVARKEARSDDGVTGGVFFAGGLAFHTGSVGTWQPYASQILDAEEAILAPQLHPAMVNLVDSGEVEGTRYLVTEYVAGTTWREALHSKSPPTLSLLIQVVDALQALHKAGCYHGDIKPDNLIIDADGAVRIIDPSSGLTTPEHMFTTPLYNPLYKPSDLPAVGLMIIELATRQQPLLLAHDGKELREVGPALEQSLCGTALIGIDKYWRSIPALPLPTEAQAGFSPDLETISLRCLGLRRDGDKLDIGEPYTDINQFAEALRAVSFSTVDSVQDAFDNLRQELEANLDGMSPFGRMAYDLMRAAAEIDRVLNNPTETPGDNILAVFTKHRRALLGVCATG